MRSNFIALLILILFAALALGSAAAVPLFEASDEGAHFLYAHTLAETGQLPLIPTRADLDTFAARDDLVGQWSVESHQPPLYYALGALLISSTTRADIDDYLRSNALIFTWGRRDANPNQWLHLPTPPAGDTHVAVWILRLFSLSLACGTLWCVYRAAFLATNSSPVALTSMLVTACIPTFAVISASVNNDNLTTLLSSAAVYWTLRVLRFGLRKYDWALIAFIVSAIALTKFTGLSVIAVVGLGMLLAQREGRITRREMLIVAAAIVAAVALNAGWWYARNFQLYGDALAMGATQSLWGRTFAVASESGGFFAEIPRIWHSFWLMVGYLHQPVWGPLWFYAAVLAFFALSCLNWGVSLARRKSVPFAGDSLIILALAAFLPVAVLIYGTLSVDISYGRLLFPGLVGIVPLIVIGLWKIAGFPAFIFAFVLFGMTAVMPYTVIRPAYPQLEAVPSLPDSAIPLDIRVDGATLSVLGYDPLPRAILAGESPSLTLYLSGSDARNPALTLSWLSPVAADNLGQLTIYPGMAPTDALADGVIYKAIAPTAPLYSNCGEMTVCERVTGLIRLELNWQVDGQTNLQTADPQGQRIPILLDGPTYSQAASTEHNDSAIRAGFGETIRLSHVEIALNTDAQLDMRLYWLIEKTPPPDLTLTVQIFDADGGFVTSADGDIAGYPARAWLAGTQVSDLRTIALPADLLPGTYTVAVGWYTRGDLARLPADAENTRDNLAIIGTFDTIMDAQ